MDSKAAEDPSLTKAGLAAMARHYLGGKSPLEGLADPLNANLRGLPPILVHVGSREILLGDSIRLAEVAGAVGVPMRLEIWSNMIHVWHAFAPVLLDGRQAIRVVADHIRSRGGFPPPGKLRPA